MCVSVCVRVTHTWDFPLARLVPFHLQLEEVAQRRHVDEGQLTHLLHVAVRQILDASDSQAALGTDDPLRRGEPVEEGGMKIQT